MWETLALMLWFARVRLDSWINMSLALSSVSSLLSLSFAFAKRKIRIAFSPSYKESAKWHFQVLAHFRLQKKKNDLAWLWLSILDPFRQRLSKVGNQFKRQYTIPWPFHINVDSRIKLNELKTAQMQISLLWFTGYFCFCLKSRNWEDRK